jgi:dihydropteroate synthase
VEKGVERALEMEADGADIIDIGGESSRPGSSYVDEAEELRRVIPLIKGIRKRSAVTISVDTRKAAVMREAIDAGADICNDISALEDDPSLASLVRDSLIPVILMHKQGIPETMQADPKYRDAVAEVKDYLFARAHLAEGIGIKRDKIILDPGIGFGKRYEDNRSLIAGLSSIAAGEYPVVAALSRKTCIGTMTGSDTRDRLAGTIAANMVAVQNGARIVRVHDVREHRDMLSVLQEMKVSGNH